MDMELAMDFEYRIRNYSKHAFLSQDMFWGANVIPLFGQSRNIKQIDKKGWILGLEVDWKQGCDGCRQNLTGLRSGRNRLEMMMRTRRGYISNFRLIGVRMLKIWMGQIM